MAADNKLERIKAQLAAADALVIGAGAGLSTSAGLRFDGERFEQWYSDFIEEYGITDMHTGGMAPFASPEERWCYVGRMIYCNRYVPGAMDLYVQLYELVKDMNYFVLTTNVDHQFWKAGFPDQRIFATQGDMGEFQCQTACHDTLYDNETAIKAMMEQQQGREIPTALLPKCPVCGGDLEVHLRGDENFAENEQWHEAAHRYENFLETHRDQNIVFMELGVGMNTPGIIKYPFWRMTYQLKDASYICINKGEAAGPKEIAAKAIYVNDDIAATIAGLKEIM